MILMDGGLGVLSQPNPPLEQHKMAKTIGVVTIAQAQGPAGSSLSKCIEERGTEAATPAASPYSRKGQSWFNFFLLPTVSRPR